MQQSLTEEPSPRRKPGSRATSAKPEDGLEIPACAGMTEQAARPEFKKLPITSITPFTFQDYPEHTACILWFSGCNMECRYCHNPELVRGELPKLPFEEVASFLESRRGLLEAVVLSGGECMMSAQLLDFARYLKSLGFKVKIDTNGTNPELLEAMLAETLIDYVALDFKAPRAVFEDITQFSGYNAFERSLKLLIASGIGLEVRTTVHADLLDAEDINAILQRLSVLGYQGNYYLQHFRPGLTLGNVGDPIGHLDIAAIKPPPGIALHTRGSRLVKNEV